MRTAIAGHASDHGSLISSRAASLGQRAGLQDDFHDVLRWAPWIGLGLVALIVLAGLALAGSVTDAADRRINVMAALLSLLGLHAVTLILWLAGLVLPFGTRRVSRVSLGWLWATMTARVAGGKRGQTPILLRAMTRMLTQARLLPWAFGIASHAIWSITFVAVLGAILFALAFHRYTLGWETTILDPQFFVRVVQSLGRIPAWFGFPVPDAAAILTPGAAALEAPEAQRAWALWLTGCIAVYGLLPRLLALFVCLAMWRARRSRMAPELSQPYYRRLSARFDVLAPTEIVDPDGAVQVQYAEDAEQKLPRGSFGDAVLLAAFELLPGHEWPPSRLPASQLPASGETMRGGAKLELLDIDGSAAGRRALLDAAARIRPRLLVLACRALSSPDRGTERLLRELATHSGMCRLWLVGDESQPDDSGARARWRRWLTDVRLSEVPAFDDLSEALDECTSASEGAMR